MQLALLSLIIIANLHRCSFYWKQHIFLLLAGSCPETLDLKDLSHKSVWWAFQEVQTFAKFWPYLEFQFPFSLCSKHFCFVSEQNKTEERILVLAAWESEQEPKNERGGRGRKETLPYLSSPTPPRSFTHAIFLIPSPSLQNHTETLAMQANFLQVTLVKLWFYKTKQLADFRKFW